MFTTKKDKMFEHVCNWGRAQMVRYNTKPSCGEFLLALAHGQDILDKILRSPPCTTVAQAKDVLEKMWSITLTLFAVQEDLNGWDVSKHLPEDYVRIHAKLRQLGFSAGNVYAMTRKPPTHHFCHLAQAELLPLWRDSIDDCRSKKLGEREFLQVLLDEDTWCSICPTCLVPNEHGCICTSR